MFRLKEIIQATCGQRLSGHPETLITGISTDTRTLRPGNLFLAIPGDRFDGHDFIEEARQKGAAAFVISRNHVRYPSSCAVVAVRNSVRALGLMALAHRKRFSIPIIAITGSTGKTTTKEMIASVLENRYTLLKNVATLNNQIGVPQTLLQLNSSHELAVIEFGTNRFGDIRWLTQITAPTVAVFTNIGESHLEFLKSSEGVFREKSNLVRYLPKKGTVIFNGNDPWLRQLKKTGKRHRFVSYGIGSQWDFSADQIRTRNNRIYFRVNERYPFALSSPVFHNIHNGLAAIACGRLFGIPVEELAATMKSFRFCSGRMSVEKIGMWWVINDTYNANPVSFRSAIETLSRFKNTGRKIAVCADMLELGRQTRSLHKALGNQLAEARPDMVLTFGPHAQSIGAALKTCSQIPAIHCKTIEGINQRLIRYCQPGDAILVKGSRGMRMERVIQFLKEKVHPASLQIFRWGASPDAR